jgi:phosphatidylglycerophosphate synthase
MMSTQTAQPLRLLHFSFDGLYARHLGRHSQFGININHIAALYGMWFGVYAAITQAARLLEMPAWWLIPIFLAGSYLAVIAINAPMHVTLATSVYLAVFVASVIALPRLPTWSILGFVAMVPIFYKIQAWGHKVWNVAADMTEFNRIFPPGGTLTIILLMYEVPICVNYLVFHREDWRR